jgi:hypothetical protein
MKNLLILFIIILSNSFSFGQLKQASLSAEDIYAIIVYPNSINGIFTVRIPSGRENRIQVYDHSGNCVKDQYCRNKTDQHVDLSKQPKGTYIMEIISDGKKTLKKVVIE